MNDKLNKLEEICNITMKWDDDDEFYDPECPSLISSINLLARLEWARRKLLEFDIKTIAPLEMAFADEYCSSDIPFSNMSLENILDNDSYDAYECCIFNNNFKDYFKDYLSALFDNLGWRFISFSTNRTEFMAAVSLDPEDVHEFEDCVDEAFVVQANDLITRIYTIIKNSDILKDESAAVKFMTYLPKWICKFYISEFYVYDGEIINNRYTCGNVLGTIDSECLFGYEVQFVSIPFRLMLVNHYANVLISKYPQLFGAEVKEAMYG